MRLEDLARAIQRADAIDPSDPAIALVTGNARLSPRDQLEIYREQFWLRHLGSLRDDFATLDHLLGSDAFDALCRAFLAAHPPTHFRLRDLSVPMERFVRETAPYLADPLLADCARLEWALLHAFDAEDAALDPSAIASVKEDEWPRAVLALHPSASVLSCAHPVKAFREEVRRGEKPARPAPEDAFYVVSRRGDLLYVEVVDRAQHAVLDSLARGVPLGAACEAALTHDPELEAKLGGWFQRWVSLGFLASVTV